MKIWEILKKENINKKYKTKIYGMDTIVKVGYDINSDTWQEEHNYKPTFYKVVSEEVVKVVKTVK